MGIPEQKPTLPSGGQIIGAAVRRIGLPSEVLSSRTADAVHGRGVHRALEGARNPDQPGWQGPLPGNIFVERLWRTLRVLQVARPACVHLRSEPQRDDKRGRMISMEGTERANIRRGSRVSIVLKEDQRTGKLTEGIVEAVLTNSPIHLHGIKVRLESGQVGRVKKIAVAR